MKRTSDMFKYVVRIAIVFAAFPVLFCSREYTGGSEIGNPLVVAGMVTDSSGKGVSDVSLYLIDPSEKDPLKLIPDSCYQTESGPDGVYQFTGVYQGVYNLFGRDTGGEMMFLRSIDINTEDAIPDKPARGSGDAAIVLDSDTLRAAANVVLAVSDYTPAGGDFLFIPGTIIRVQVDSSGEYLIKCPQSTIDITRFRNDSLFVLYKDLTVLQGQWIDLTGKSYDVPSPLILSGVNTGITGRMYSFFAGKITLGPNHPVQYRFDWGDSVSQWSLSDQGNHAWNTPGNFSVRVQARSVRDMLSVSEWSDAVGVLIQ